MLIHFKPKLKGDWRSEFAQYGVRVYSGSDVVAVIAKKGRILVANCSKTKGERGQVAYPKEFYKGQNAQLTIAFAEAHKLPYGILSDMYGIHFDDEALPYYDTHPSEVIDKEGLAEILRCKCEERFVTSVVYRNSSPARARFYIDLLLLAGLEVVYVTSLDGRGRGFGLIGS